MSEVATQVVQAPDVSKYMYQIRKLKDALAAKTAEAQTYKGDADRLAKENGELKTKGDTSQLAKRNQELEARLRTIEHRKVLDKIAVDKGINPKALDGFYELSKYEAKGEPSEEEIGAFVDSKIEEFSYLKGETKTQEEPAAKKPVVGSGKGGRTVASFEIPPEGDPRWNDTTWQWKNQDKLAAAYAEREEKGIV